MGELNAPSPAVMAMLRKQDKNTGRQAKLEKLATQLSGFKYDAKNKQVVSDSTKDGTMKKKTKKKTTKKKPAPKKLWVVVDGANEIAGVYDDVKKANTAAEEYTSTQSHSDHDIVWVQHITLNAPLYTHPKTKDGQTITLDGAEYVLKLKASV
jgi:hypothetical protein